MAKVDVLDQAGKKTGTRDLAADVFEAPVNVPLMHQVVVAGLAGIRSGSASTKTRGEVSGGGRKPWRQKGTGRARHGSIRSPQWTGGGVAHGPRARDHSMRLNKKMRRGALRSALSDALASDKLAVVSGLDFEGPKTRRAVEVLGSLRLEGRILLVLPAPTDNGVVERSFRNLPHVKVVYAGGLGTYDVLLADRILLTTEAVDVLEASRARDAGAEGGERS
jgi:large subunit ribosomal protein L4